VLSRLIMQNCINSLSGQIGRKLKAEGRPIPSPLFIRSRACHPERRARLCAWRSAIVRHPRVAKDLLFSYLAHPPVAKDLLFSYLATVHYTLELTLDKKKFLFVSLDGLIADIAWQVVKEGHEVKLFIEAKDEQEIADGFVPKTDDWVRDVPWADVVVFDDVLGQGAKAHQLRQTGKLVVGGSPYTDQLEDDRAFGQQEAQEGRRVDHPTGEFSFVR